VNVFDLAHRLWQVQIQFTFGLYDATSGAPVRHWNSVSVTNFKTPPPPNKGVTLDKRSAKSDQFSITLDPARPDTYLIEGQYDADLAVSLEFSRLPGVPGWKLGGGPRGGMTYFGTKKPATANSGSEPDRTAGGDGYAIHRFWPRASVKGIIRRGGAIIDVPEGSRGVFIHAIQGMRPNLVASRWNFADFQSPAADGVSLILMEFTATSAYGAKKVAVGSVVVDDKLVAVTVGPSEGVGHRQAVVDKETGYKVPRQLAYTWSGPAIGAAKGTAPVTAELILDVPEDPARADKSGFSSRHLIAKVSVLAEIPYLVRKVISMAGTNPYIYRARSPLPYSSGACTHRLAQNGSPTSRPRFRCLRLMARTRGSSPSRAPCSARLPSSRSLDRPSLSASL
jgi:hypothetical protein